jgi:hypothetical protein
MLDAWIKDLECKPFGPIVDLMKALDLDSSLKARTELAQELKYTGDTHDTATMNVWLHKQIMGKRAANGGKLPSNIKT